VVAARPRWRRRLITNRPTDRAGRRERGRLSRPLSLSARHDGPMETWAADARRCTPAASRANAPSRRHRELLRRSWKPPPNRTADRARWPISARASHERHHPRRSRTRTAPGDANAGGSSTTRPTLVPCRRLAGVGAEDRIQARLSHKSPGANVRRQLSPSKGFWEASETNQSPGNGSVWAAADICDSLRRKRYWGRDGRTSGPGLVGTRRSKLRPGPTRLRGALCFPPRSCRQS
jgi:hypothetical protein